MSRAFSAENNSFAAQALGVSSDWLATGKGDMKKFERAGVGQLSPAPQAGKPTVVVPLLANAASMGPGNDVLEHDVMTGDLHLNEEWIAQRVRPSTLSALRFIHGYGDSMKGTFNDGDIMLVDTGVKIVDIDGVYVLSAHDRLFIKRVRQRWDGKFEISSDNPGIKTSDILDGREELDVRGRVLWAWNGQKL
ncbi:helix-turn-helix transcriptional regulator [Diaphorobacter sp. HDW4B]|nr:helix-turn-helix transcriptional regulator [Diaphorobacter sp. HDW4B]